MYHITLIASRAFGFVRLDPKCVPRISYCPRTGFDETDWALSTRGPVICGLKQSPQSRNMISPFSAWRGIVADEAANRALSKPQARWYFPIVAHTEALSSRVYRKRNPQEDPRVRVSVKSVSREGLRSRNSWHLWKQPISIGQWPSGTFHRISPRLWLVTGDAIIGSSTFSYRHWHQRERL